MMPVFRMLFVSRLPNFQKTSAMKYGIHVFRQRQNDMNRCINVIVIVCAVVWCNLALISSAQSSQAKPTIKGQIVTTLGLPLIGASIEAHYGGRFLEAVTDSQGRYEFSGLPEGPVFLQVVGAGSLNILEPKRSKSGYLEYGRPSKSIEIRQGNAYVIDFVVYANLNDVPPRKTEIEGSVNQSDNSPLSEGLSPLSDVTVKAISAFTQEVQIVTTTDSAGRYALTIPIEGQFIILASKPGFMTSVSPVLARGGKRTLNLSLPPLRLR
jgi:hypothetical protein